MDFVIRHPPWAAITCRKAGTALVFVKAFEEMIALTNIKSTRSLTLKNVDKIHQIQLTGRDLPDPNSRDALILLKLVGTPGFEPGIFPTRMVGTRYFC